MTAALLTRSNTQHTTQTDRSTQSARATRFLEFVPPRLTEDLLFSLRVLRINRESGSAVVSDLRKRLAAELTGRNVALPLRADVKTLVQALSAHRAAAVELANHVASPRKGGAL